MLSKLDWGKSKLHVSNPSMVAGSFNRDLHFIYFFISFSNLINVDVVNGETSKRTKVS